MQEDLTVDLPAQVNRAYDELGPHPTVYREEGLRRLDAAMQATRDGDVGHAILLTGIAQGFLTLHARLVG